MKAVIIAGGKGTRLRPLTNDLPKSIVPVINRPFIIHQIELLATHGIDEIIINLHYLSQEIKKVLGDGRKWGVKIDYSIESSPLGTAGAVKNAEEFFDSGPLIIFNGDVLTDLNISKLLNFHQQKQAAVTLTLTEVDDPTPFGLVLVDEQQKVKSFVEKPGWNLVTARTINAGTYVVDPKIFDLVPKGVPFSFERELFPRLLKEAWPIFGFASSAYWLDIGNPQKYKEAHQAILRGEVAVNIHGTRTDGKFWFGRQLELDTGVKFLGPSVIGDKVKIGKETEIKDFVVIGDQVTIGSRCSLDRAIIWQGTKIGNRVSLVDCVVGAHCVIEDDVIIEHGAVLASHSVVSKEQGLLHK
ncbi:nucleotidyl transferase [Candidatus Saganbacteria bacterium CG08_land_8_20_14_0_20_45_16]|uniref:Nucleotidyl transferase n=1 Tax=Candidatus Saganbacteria bacterium CG08_land_8_20_14_0_20_45_16 TaxID=2014293 RepID=A0A2H0Y3W7_UNCSA|nr:MAG: nucleotidyl transferase [Candidatus Saganbacteria bacterium CG08_land_8_20_14_0_20_45_16]